MATALTKAERDTLDLLSFHPQFLFDVRDTHSGVILFASLAKFKGFKTHPKKPEAIPDEDFELSKSALKKGQGAFVVPSPTKNTTHD